MDSHLPNTSMGQDLSAAEWIDDVDTWIGGELSVGGGYGAGVPQSTGSLFGDAVADDVTNSGAIRAEEGINDKTRRSNGTATPAPSSEPFVGWLTGDDPLALSPRAGKRSLLPPLPAASVLHQSVQHQGKDTGAPSTPRHGAVSSLRLLPFSCRESEVGAGTSASEEDLRASRKGLTRSPIASRTLSARRPSPAREG